MEGQPRPAAPSPLRLAFDQSCPSILASRPPPFPHLFVQETPPPTFKCALWERMYKPGERHIGNTICSETNGPVADVNRICRMATLHITCTQSHVLWTPEGREAHAYTSRYKQGHETGCPNGTYTQGARGTQTNPHPQTTCANIHRHTYTHSSPLTDIRQTQASLGTPTNTDPLSEQMQLEIRHRTRTHRQANTNTQVDSRKHTFATHCHLPTRVHGNSRTPRGGHDRTPARAHTAHALLIRVSFSKTSLRTPCSLSGSFTPGKSQRCPETQPCRHPPSPGTGHTFPSLGT